eukprot:scaffold395495_cov47-Attheya_sp.AAC.2
MIRTTIKETDDTMMKRRAMTSSLPICYFIAIAIFLSSTPVSAFCGSSLTSTGVLRQSTHHFERRRVGGTQFARSTRLCGSSAGKIGDDSLDAQQRRLQANDRDDDGKRAIYSELVRALACPPTSSLVELKLSGRGKLPIHSNTTDDQTSESKAEYLDCFFLEACGTWSQKESVSALPVFVGKNRFEPALKLISFAFRGTPISKSLCLGLNPLLINRDGGLFDNLPWSSWTVDPQWRNRDAASNEIDPKFHLGKRDAYQRFMGKDWKGRSLAIGNLALRAKYSLNEQQDDDNDDDTDCFNEEAASSLTRRLLELELKERRMDLANEEERVAILRMEESAGLLGEQEEMTASEILQNAIEELQKCRDRLERSQSALDSLKRQANSGKNEMSFLSALLDDIAARTTRRGENAAPYRGATGYAPLLDSLEDVSTSTLPYTGPCDLMKNIIQDQLHADVIGAILENTSLLEGNFVLGGALILRRRSAQRTITIDGETLEIPDRDQDFGNSGLGEGETFLVECESDEALGMALACNIPVSVESQIWGNAQITVKRSERSKNDNEDDGIMDILPYLDVMDAGGISIKTEGDSVTRQDSTATSPIRLPRTTASLFESFFESNDRKGPVFNTENPIQSVSEYDALSNSDKAALLMTLESFRDKLPRPRVLRNSMDDKNKNILNPLDQFLVPLIDESVRRPLLIRDAEERGDEAKLNELLELDKSQRQIYKEKAEVARDEELFDLAEQYEAEADFYAGLRADVTQDEGSYSRYLDQDESYERNRRAQAEKLKKKNLFGTLLDGIE